MLVELCVLTAAYQSTAKLVKTQKIKKKGSVKFVPRQTSRNDIRHSWNLHSAHSNPTQQMERFSNSLKRDG